MHPNGRVTPNPCLQDLLVTGRLNGTNNYLANKITLNANIQTGTTVFGAQSIIAMEADFEVGLGAVFTAGISRCGSGAEWQYEYFLQDHLGNNRILFADKNGNHSIEVDEVLQENHYYAFGLAMEGDWAVEPVYENRYRYNGKELNTDLGLYDYGARDYDPAIGRWLQVDPLADQFPGWSPYNYVEGNPITNIDPDGRSTTSTHTDKDGNVLAVYDDGDLGVYKHDDATSASDVAEKREESNSTGGGGERMGETEYWDEFVSPETGQAMTRTQIRFGESWDPILDPLKEQAKGMNLVQIAGQSGPEGDFDVKNDHAEQGRLLNGKYVSSRSAGNYLAGYNASGSTMEGIGGVSFTTFQKLAGALHIKGSVSTAERTIIVVTGKAYGPAPAYGEVDYQYRMSLKGWQQKGADRRLRARRIRRGKNK